MSNKDNRSKKTRIRLLLILSNFYEEGFPSWPEIMGIYGYNISNKTNKIDWIMPAKINSSNGIVRKFLATTIYLIPFTRSESVILKALSYFRYYIKLSKFLITYHKDYDFIQVRDDVFSGIFATAACIIFKKFFIFNYSYPYYQSILDERELSHRKKMSIRLFYWKIHDIILKHIMLKKADFIFPISQEMVDQMCFNGISRDKMLPMPLGVEPLNFRLPKHKKVDREQLGFDKGDVIFLYIGSITKARGLDIIIRALNRAIIKSPQIKLLFVGQGNSMESLKELSRHYDLEKDILFTGNIAYSLVPEYVHLSNVCLSIINPLKCFYVSSPCKLFEYLYAGRPVIANEEIPEHRRIVQSSKSGLLVRYDEDSIAKAMLDMVSICSDTDRYKQLSENGHKWIIENRTFNLISKNIEQIYLNLLNK